MEGLREICQNNNKVINKMQRVGKKYKSLKKQRKGVGFCLKKFSINGEQREIAWELGQCPLYLRWGA
jgi:hypothetical protein